jgi:hypothetical protein
MDVLSRGHRGEGGRSCFKTVADMSSEKGGEVINHFLSWSDAVQLVFDPCGTVPVARGER